MIGVRGSLQPPLATCLFTASSVQFWLAIRNQPEREMAMKFGSKIRELRQQKGLRQKAVSEMVGVTDAYLSKVENHRLDFGEFPSEKLIHKLAEVLDADETELLLLAEKVPEPIKRRVFERPEAFLKIAELDDKKLDKLLKTL